VQQLKPPYRRPDIYIAFHKTLLAFIARQIRDLEQRIAWLIE